MKKLMIAAAAVAMIGAAQAELCYETVGAEGCAVYNLKFKFKTLAAKADSKCGATWLIRGENTVIGNRIFWMREDVNGVLVSDETVKAGEAHDQTAKPPVRAAKQVLYWADNATRTFDGLAWQCELNCFEGLATRGLMTPEARATSHLYYAIWEKKSSTLISLPVFRFYANKAKTSYGWMTWDAQFDFGFLGRYGQKATKVAASYVPTLIRGQQIQAVGFGTFDAKNNRIKSLSGNAVAMLRPLNTRGGICAPEQFFIQIAPMCTDFEGWCCDGCYVAAELVPGSGTWSMKYNSSLSKGKKSLAKLLPSYVVFDKSFPFFTQIVAAANVAIQGTWANAKIDNSGYIDFTKYMAEDDEDVDVVQAAYDVVQLLALNIDQVFDSYYDKENKEFIDYAVVEKEADDDDDDDE